MSFEGERGVHLAQFRGVLRPPRERDYLASASLPSRWSFFQAISKVSSVSNLCDPEVLFTCNPEKGKPFGGSSEAILQPLRDFQDGKAPRKEHWPRCQENRVPSPALPLACCVTSFRLLSFSGAKHSSLLNLPPLIPTLSWNVGEVLTLHVFNKGRRPRRGRPRRGACLKVFPGSRAQHSPL